MANTTPSNRPLPRKNARLPKGWRTARNVAAAAALGVALSSGHRLPYTAAELLRMSEQAIARIPIEKIEATLSHSQAKERGRIIDRLPDRALVRIPRTELAYASEVTLIRAFEARNPSEKKTAPSEMLAILSSTMTRSVPERIRKLVPEIPNEWWNDPRGRMIGLERAFQRAHVEASQAKYRYVENSEGVGSGSEGLGNISSYNRMGTFIYFLQNGRFEVENGIVQTRRMRLDPGVNPYVDYFVRFEQQLSSAQLQRLMSGTKPEVIRKELGQ